MPPIIAVENLGKSYGSHTALEDLSFEVGEGGVVGFLGVNGAGKSTFMRILAGFLQPTTGKASVCGLDVVADSLAVRQRIGYLPESNPLYPELRVREFLRYRARVKGVPARQRPMAIDRALQRCWLGEVSERIIGQLSKGYRQRVGLADCMLSDAPLLILDEPTVGLDPNQMRAIRQLITEMAGERTIFLSTHILNDAERLCREVIIIHNGRLLAVDTPAALCERSTRPAVLLLEMGVGVKAATELENLDGISEVNEESLGSGGEQLCRIVCNGNIDNVRLAVLNLCHERGWPLRAMRLEPVRLEDIFAEITAPAVAAEEVTV